MKKYMISDKKREIENPLLPPIVIEDKKVSGREKVIISLFGASGLCILPLLAFGLGNLSTIAIIWIIIFLFFLVLGFKGKKTKIVIGNGFIRTYKLTPPKSLALISEDPYSSFCEVEFVLYTKDVWAGNVEAYLIRNKGRKLHLFTFAELKGANIASYDEAEHLAKSISHELGIPINMREDDTMGSW
jgi:hypothetical protein